jgi:formate dehydrogenase subunit gamma
VRILRFDRVQRGAHWANAALFGVLMTTALPLYFGSLAVTVGRRHLMAEIHLWAGLALPIPLIVSLVGPWGARMRQDVRRVNRWTRDEVRWLRSFGKVTIRFDKFNPDQKLNVLFVAGTVVVMLATGAVMQLFGWFPVSWRTGATFVHDVVATVVFVVVTGHVAFALTHPEALRSIIRGWVTEQWAARHAPAWVDELHAGDDPPPTDP